MDTLPAPNAFVSSPSDILAHLKSLVIPFPERKEKHIVDKAFFYGGQIRDLLFKHGVIEDETMDPLLCVQRGFWFAIQVPSTNLTWTKMVCKFPDLYMGILKLRNISESRIYRVLGKDEFMKMSREKSIADLNALIGVKYVKNEISDLLKEISALKIKVESARDGMAYYKGRATFYKEEIDRLELEMADLVSANDELEKKLEEALSTKKGLDVEHTKMVGCMEILQGKLQEQSGNTSKLEEVMKANESILFTIQNEKSRVDAEVVDLNEKMKKCIEENRGLKQQRDDHMIQISKLNQQVDEFKKCIEKQEVLIEWMQAEKESYNGEMSMTISRMEKDFECEKMKLMETYGDMVKDTNDHFEELGQRLRSSDAIKNELFSQVDMLGKEKMALSTRVNELEGDIELLKISNGDLREEREILLRRSSEVSSSSVSTTSFRALVWKGVYKINKERFEKEKGKLIFDIKHNIGRKEELKKQVNNIVIENNTNKQKLAKVQSENVMLKRNRLDLEEVAEKTAEKVVKKYKL